MRAPIELAPSSGPVVVKLLSPDILHKTDAGLVRLNVTGQDAIKAAVQETLERAGTGFPDARIRGVLVAPMERGLTEVILGYRHDPEVGPVVMLGVGGVLAELKHSVCVRLAPVDEAIALDMIYELPELRAITGSATYARRCRGTGTGGQRPVPDRLPRRSPRAGGGNQPADRTARRAGCGGRGRPGSHSAAAG